MGRLPRTVDDCLVCHALDRVNNRADLFGEDDDRVAFLEALAKTKERYPFRLLGYCFMTDHFHLLLRPEAGQSISRTLQSLTVAHTWRYHKRYRTLDHVWQGRFKSPVIQHDAHLLVVLRYIEANPLRAKMVTDPAEYQRSSLPYHGLGQDDPPSEATRGQTRLAVDSDRRDSFTSSSRPLDCLRTLVSVANETVAQARPSSARLPTTGQSDSGIRSRDRGQAR
jgi:REP element-mobilizing transposase RayT